MQSKVLPESSLFPPSFLSSFFFGGDSIPVFRYASTRALVREWNIAGTKRLPISTIDPINVTANVIVDRENGPLLQALASDSDGWVDHMPDSPGTATS